MMPLSTDPPSVPPAVRFEGVSRHFGAVRAVDDVSFEVADGEFFTFLGPSGSGKTTCLRLIAGFEEADAGVVYLGGQRANRRPPYERDVHTVFQDYALFPHMSVLDNVAYSLMVRRVPRAERHRQAEAALELVRLTGLGARRPAQLSGGQRQRVALARALVGRPKVLLLDEPLGALDLKLREQMQVELKALQEQVGITFVYVTHDQEEALSMSDRLAVFNRGRIEQLGPPREIYDHPATPFVAGFVGTSNLLEGEVAERILGAPGALLVRPERVHFTSLDTPVTLDQASVTGTVQETQYLGMYTRYRVALEAGGLLTVAAQHGAARPGERVRLLWQREHMHVLDAT